jgi:integral membrane protein
MIQLMKTNLGRLRITAIIEGITYLLLAFTMILKYNYATPLPNKIVGMMHGVFFILYVVLVLVVGINKKWSFKIIFLALLASLIPFGTFFADARIFNRRK